MRRISCFLLLILLIFIMSSCGDNLYVNSGIENFSIHDSEYGLNTFLFPLNFMDLYDYSDGGYDYYEKFGYATSLVFMQYEESVYNEAKEYALQELELVEKSEETYKGYVFLKRNGVFDDPKEEYRFYFAYSDEQRILLAVATYMDYSYPYKSTSLTDYLNTYFSFYNFENGRIEKETQTESTEPWNTDDNFTSSVTTKKQSR